MNLLLKRIYSSMCTWRALSSGAKAGSGFKSNFRSVLTRCTTLGRECHLNGLIVKGKGVVSIGDCFHCGKNVRILTSNHKYDFGNSVPYCTVETIDKSVSIGNYVWIGEGAMLLGGAELMDGVIVQANAVVSGKVPYCAIVGGNPAKVFKYRDVQSYEKLVARADA